MKVTLTSVLIFLALLVDISCFQERNSFSDDDLAGGSVSGSSAFISALAVIQASCAGAGGCHGDSTNLRKYAKFTTQAQFTSIGAVSTDGNPCNSTMFLKINGHGCSGSAGNMPIGGTLSSTQIQTIRDWITCLPSGCP